MFDAVLAPTIDSPATTLEWAYINCRGLTIWELALSEGRAIHIWLLHYHWCCNNHRSSNHWTADHHRLLLHHRLLHHWLLLHHRLLHHWLLLHHRLLLHHWLERWSTIITKFGAHLNIILATLWASDCLDRTTNHRHTDSCISFINLWLGAHFYSWLVCHLIYTYYCNHCY